MKIFLFRHGEYVNPDNIQAGRLQGYHLSELGKSQIRNIAKKLVNEDIKSIYSSPLERTKESAEIIADVLGIDKSKIVFSEDITETDLRDWMGKSKKIFKEKSFHYKDPSCGKDVESLMDCGKRVLDFINKIAENNTNSALVSHGDPIMGALVSISGSRKIYDEDYIKVGSYFVIEGSKDHWQIVDAGVAQW